MEPICFHDTSSTDAMTPIPPPDTGRSDLPMPSANGDVRLIWKLKGTGKKFRRDVIAECVKGQPVFIICDSNGANCTVITEEGEELGRLNKRDSEQYHQFVEKKLHHIYIKRIRLDGEKPRVKILLIVHDEPPFPLDRRHEPKQTTIPETVR